MKKPLQCPTCGVWRLSWLLEPRDAHWHRFSHDLEKAIAMQVRANLKLAELEEQIAIRGEIINAMAGRDD